jgi:hypothetical protein
MSYIICYFFSKMNFQNDLHNNHKINIQIIIKPNYKFIYNKIVTNKE